MPPNFARPENPPKSPSRSPWLAVVATLLAAGFFLSGLGNEPFADEYAYLTQAYFTDLGLAGKVDDPAWLEYPAYDLPPLPKYLIGLSLHAAGIPLPSRKSAVDWYEDINRRFGSPQALIVARIPSALMGAAGCLAIYALGSLAVDRRAGWIAFCLLMVNPLYGLHARRAMSDVPCEALILASLACGLIAWILILRGRWAAIVAWASFGFAGVFAGLALLAKFNGMLAILTLAAWCVLGISLPGRGIASKVALAVGSAGAAVLAFGLFVGLNPFMFTHPSEKLPEEFAAIERMNPWQRFRFQMKHRADISEGQQQLFEHNALITPVEKIKVVVVQGFGRFGPFGKHGWSSAEKTSERRYEWSQDWGALIWGPMVFAGGMALWIAGRDRRRSGDLPTGWLVAAWALVTFGVVTVYIPMAWDRYLMPIQSVSCLLAASFLSLGWESLGRFRSAEAGAEMGDHSE